MLNINIIPEFIEPVTPSILKYATMSLSTPSIVLVAVAFSILVSFNPKVAILNIIWASLGSENAVLLKYTLLSSVFVITILKASLLLFIRLK